MLFAMQQTKVRVPLRTFSTPNSSICELTDDMHVALYMQASVHQMDSINAEATLQQSSKKTQAHARKPDQRLLQTINYQKHKPGQMRSAGSIGSFILRY